MLGARNPSCKSRSHLLKTSVYKPYPLQQPSNFHFLLFTSRLSAFNLEGVMIQSEMLFNFRVLHGNHFIYIGLGEIVAFMASNCVTFAFLLYA